MTRIGEIIAFTGIAIAVHVGLFVQFDPSGVQSQGAKGQASISLMAASADMVDRVAAWTRPVDVMQELPTTPHPTPRQSPSMPAVSPPQIRNTPTIVPALPRLAPAVPEALPRVDTQTAAPPRPRHAPQTSPRPQPRVAQKPEPAAKPRPQQKEAAPAKPQKAQGGATGNNAGAAQTPQSASLSKAARQSLMAKWGASIRNRVERRKRYPSGITASGTTVLRITISRSGRLQGVAVVRSSGTRSLDQAAIKAVQKGQYSAAPKGLKAAQYQFNLPVAFRRK